MFVFKNRTQSLFEMIQDGFKLLLSSYKQIWPWAGVLAILIGLVPEMMLDYLPFEPTMFGNLPFIVLSFLILLGAVFCASVILHRMYVVGSNAKDPLSTTLREVKEKYRSLLLGYLLAWLVTNIGFILLFFPGVFIGVSLLFVLPLILFDNYSVSEAFHGSWLLVTDNWWRIFIVIFLPLIIMSYGVFWLSGLAATATVAKTILVFLIVPLFYALVLNAFYDAKLRHHVPLHLRLSKREEKKAQSTKQKSKSKTKTKREKKSNKESAETKTSTAG